MAVSQPSDKSYALRPEDLAWRLRRKTAAKRRLTAPQADGLQVRPAQASRRGWRNTPPPRRRGAPACRRFGSPAGGGEGSEGGAERPPPARRDGPW